MSTDQIRVDYVLLSDVQRWPRNPKRHDEPALEASMGRFGYTQPILLDEKSGKLVAGHGRLEMLSALKAAGKPAPKRIVERAGEWYVPVIRGVSFENEQEAEAYLLADNKLVEGGGWDEAEVAEILRDLAKSSEDATLAYSGIGYSDQDVARILRLLPQAPENVSFNAYGEEAAADVAMVECPQCKHKFPR